MLSSCHKHAKAYVTCLENDRIFLPEAEILHVKEVAGFDGLSRASAATSIHSSKERCHPYLRKSVLFEHTASRGAVMGEWDSDELHQPW